MPTQKDTKTSKAKTVKPSSFDLPIRHKKFADNYLETGRKRLSALKAGYSETSAHVQATRLLKNDKVRDYLNDHVEEAKGVLVALMRNAENEQVRRGAANDVLDRTEGKPVQRSESVSVSITVETMLDSASPDAPK